MICDLLPAGPPVLRRLLATALVDAVGVGPVDVDVADKDADQSRRDWAAPVLCGYSRLRGDLSMSLDIYVVDHLVDEALSEYEFAQRLAAALGVPVLYPAVEDVPSAYWLAAPSGDHTRARLFASDDVPPLHMIDAVQSAVPQLPHVRPAELPEIVLEQRATGSSVSDTATDNDQ